MRPAPCGPTCAGQRRDLAREGRDGPIRAGGVASRPVESGIERGGGLDEIADRPQTLRTSGTKHVEDATGDLAAQPFRIGRSSVRQRQPGPAVGEARQAGRSRRIRGAQLPKPALDLTPTDRPQTDPNAARSNRRQQAFLVVGAENDGDSRGRLLEQFEERVLGVVVQPVGGLYDGHAGAALYWQKGEFRDQAPDGPGLGVGGTADPHLASGASGREPVEIRVVARGHLAAAPT